jgi:hypothetical protein
MDGSYQALPGYPPTKDKVFESLTTPSKLTFLLSDVHNCNISGPVTSVLFNFLWTPFAVLFLKQIASRTPKHLFSAFSSFGTPAAVFLNQILMSSF